MQLYPLMRRIKPVMTLKSATLIKRRTGAFMGEMRRESQPSKAQIATRGRAEIAIIRNP
jgi:hypothetical protein